MVKYVHKFPNEAAFRAKYYGNQYLEPWVSLTKNAGYTEGEERVNYNKTGDEPLTPEEFINQHISEPLKFKALGSGRFVLGEIIMLSSTGE
jgi:hypothetical protein